MSATQSRYGNPLYLPDQQVGLNTLALPPRWDPAAASHFWILFFPGPSRLHADYGIPSASYDLSIFFGLRLKIL